MAYFEFDFFSECVRQSVHGVAIIPAGCRKGRNTEPPYKTLYLLPGHSDNAARILRDSKIDFFAEQRGVAVIIPDGMNSFYVDRNPDCRFSTMVGEELVNVSRKWFNLSHKREDTFLSGMSMGGFGAIYNGCKYADTFSKVAALCPPRIAHGMRHPDTGAVLFTEAFLNEIFGSEENGIRYYDPIAVIQNAYAAGKLPNLFIGVGKDDKLCGPAIREIVAACDKEGIPHEFRMVEGAHDFVFMDNIYPLMFDFLLG